MYTKSRDRRGAQAVEFVLVLPILIMLVSATIDYGWYFQQAMLMTTATQQAARAASTESADDYVSVGEDVGEHVWDQGDYGTEATFTVTTVTSNGVDLDANTGSLAVQVVGTVDVQCLFCFPFVSLPDEASHLAVEHWFNQGS